MRKPRILIAGTNSGCGKTTVTIAILGALKKYFPDIVAYKCGPDYIDPGFHRAVQNINSYNLDKWFLDEPHLINHFLKTSSNSISVIEGVMGLFDGIGIEGKGSTFEIARNIEAPIILVINARGMANSIRAVVKGFKEMCGEYLHGIILNKVSESFFPYLKTFCEMEGVPCLGFIPNDHAIEIGSRHLGLLTSLEVKNLKDKVDILQDYATKYIDIKKIIEIARQSKFIDDNNYVEKSPAVNTHKFRLAMAKDEAFCFTYQENLELMKQKGIEIVPFSPIRDISFPRNISGLYLPGGYPELYAEQLSNNVNLKRIIRGKILEGLPTVAECGGFLYLHEYLDGYPMLDVIPGSANKQNSLQRFGYGKLVSNTDNLLLQENESIPIHEFHYYSTSSYGDECIFRRESDGKEFPAEHAGKNLFAGFPHLYLPSKPIIVDRFIQAMMHYKDKTLYA